MTDAPPDNTRTGWAVASLSLGTLLNPLNSSMIAVALVPLQRDFQVSVTTVTWVITSFYLASAAGQPLMGRFADRFGPRRLFLFGMLVVVLACALTPFSSSLAAVCAGRVALAVGTATAFPSAIAMLRTVSAHTRVGTPRLLGRIQIANTSGAAIGPVLGGALITFLGWQAIFWINVPLAVLAFLGVRFFAPGMQRASAYRCAGSWRSPTFPASCSSSRR
ncbi:MFS transporter [Leifsonia sp. L25]|uniref:MFS transporter n=1 Tax=Actinomycetes TaxID=1760 RepID=UPI003D6981DF